MKLKTFIIMGFISTSCLGGVAMCIEFSTKNVS